MITAEYLTGDQFSDVCRIALTLVEGGEVLLGPGEYVLTWKRHGPYSCFGIRYMSNDGTQSRVLSSGKYGPRSSTHIPLPLLRPPRDALVALLNVPTIAKLHTPTPMHLMVRNRHTSRLAVISVSLDPQASDGFVVAGLRSGRLPLVLPGGEERVTWNVIPIECGYVKVPRVRVMDHRSGGEGEVVRVVDVRFEGWKGREEEEHTILVLPC